MLRALATAIILAILGLNVALPYTELGQRGPSAEPRLDITPTGLAVGQAFPDTELPDLSGGMFSFSRLRGEPAVIIFERSVDWCPFTKSRLLSLRDPMVPAPDPNKEEPEFKIVWVMSSEQISDRTLRFIDECGLRDRVLFLVDEQSALFRSFGVLVGSPEVLERGVPHPTTLLVDAAGIVRLIDVREDYRNWLDPSVLIAALDALGEPG